MQVISGETGSVSSECSCDAAIGSARRPLGPEAGRATSHPSARSLGQARERQAASQRHHVCVDLSPKVTLSLLAQMWLGA